MVIEIISKLNQHVSINVCSLAEVEITVHYQGIREIVQNAYLDGSSMLQKTSACHSITVAVEEMIIGLRIRRHVKLIALPKWNKIYAYCLLHLGNATTTQSGGTMTRIMCGVHHSTMAAVVATRTTSPQCKTVSNAVKVDTARQNQKKSLEQNGVSSMMIMGPVLSQWPNGSMTVVMECVSSSFMEAVKEIRTSSQQGKNVNKDVAVCKMLVICLEWWVLVVAACRSGIMIVVQMPVMSLIMEDAKETQIASMIANSVKSTVK